MTKPLTYADAGLNLDTYAQSMAGVAGIIARTWGANVLRPPFKGAGGKGGSFASLFDLGAAGRYKHPVLVTCTDGVGSKLKIASLMNRFDTVGIDLVAMSVNDLICSGGEPLVFLDYLAMHADDPARTTDLVGGVAKACEECGCALVGGETAILPDFYQPGDFDLAGFCAGVVEKDEVIDGSRIQPGDMLIGLAASGVHSNGYSLVRKVVFDVAKLTVHTHVAEFGKSLGEELLTPTRLYAKVVRATVTAFGQRIHGLANITGGGLPDNLGRILPPNRRAVVRHGSWPTLPVFDWLQSVGNIEPAEMAKVFNLGVGFVIVTEPTVVDAVLRTVQSHGISAWPIGEVAAGEAGVEMV